MDKQQIRIPRVKTNRVSSSTTEIIGQKMDSTNKSTLPLPPPPLPSVNYNEEEIVKPKKLQNPYKESVVRQNLHKELLFNQRIGKQVLNKKTELEKAVERVQHKKPVEPVQPEEKGEFQRVLQERAKLIEDNRYFVDSPTSTSSNKSDQETEFIKIHKKIFSSD